MKKKLSIFLLCINFPLMASSHWDMEQVKVYVESSELQRRSSIKILGKEGIYPEDITLDIGCGDGRTTSLISSFANKGLTYGIDPNINMYSLARKQYTKLDFPSLQFKEGSYESVEKQFADENFSLITGFLSFHLVPLDKRDYVIKSMYKKLKPGGRLLQVIPPALIGSNFYNATNKILSKKKWSLYLKNYSSDFHFESLEKLRERYEKNFPGKIKVEFISSQDPFVTKRDFVLWIKGTFGWIQKIPNNLKESVIEEIIDKYSEFDLAAYDHDQQVYYGNFGRIEVVGYKPL